MTETNVFQLLQPGTFADSLAEVLRNGDERCLPRLVETEVADLLGRHADDLTEDGRRRLARRFCVIISVPFYHISQCRHQTNMGGPDRRIAALEAVVQRLLGGGEASRPPAMMCRRSANRRWLPVTPRPRSEEAISAQCGRAVQPPLPRRTDASVSLLGAYSGNRRIAA